jgi:putative intracellular protease/amidase
VKIMRFLNVVLFDGFESLDAFGPVAVLSRLPECITGYFSLEGAVVIGAQGVRIETQAFSALAPRGILLVPGGAGTRRLVDDKKFIAALRLASLDAQYTLGVCTGAALLARAGLLDGKQAASNKKALAWVRGQSGKVLWQDRARWAVDGSIYTSSGVSAGIDMALGFAADTQGEESALFIARHIEYNWTRDKDHDPFAPL